MNERWVCKRCYADNEEADAACHRCGLARGADASGADQATWAAQAGAAPNTKRGWTRWLSVLGVPILIGVVALVYLNFFAGPSRDSSGRLTEAGTMAVTDLRAGDCFNAGETTEISDVEAMPCTLPHAYEVYHVATHETATFPTDAELDTIFGQVCIEPFATYVGTAYKSSEIYANFITPSEDSFAGGDRGYICVLFDLANDALTTSLRGAAR